MNKKSILIITLIVLAVAIMNQIVPFISVPIRSKMEGYQIDYITISTVFAGFSFTILGIMLGLSSEELIKRISGTRIIINQVKTIVTSIVLFMISVAISILFVLGLDNSIIRLLNEHGVCGLDTLTIVDSILYILGIGYLIGGIAYFSISVRQFYKLIVHIYSYNRHKSDKRIAKLQNELSFSEKPTSFDDEGDLIQ